MSGRYGQEGQEVLRRRGVMDVCSRFNARREATCEIVLAAATTHRRIDGRMRSFNLPGERETLAVREPKRSGLFIPVDAG